MKETLALDTDRNDLIFDDILSALEKGRSPVVITERKDHLDLLEGRLSKFAKNVIVLRGGMSARQARAAAESLATIPDAGRLHRLHGTKRDVVVYDYVDGNEPMLAKMAAKREAGYRSLGYRAVSSAELNLGR